MDPKGDDLEQRLDEFYRGLRESGRRVEGQWTRIRVREMSHVPWAVAGAIGIAAVVLIALSLRRPETEIPIAPIEVARPTPRPTPPPAVPPHSEPPRRVEPGVETPAPAPKPEVKPPVTAIPTETPRTESPTPSPAPAPDLPKPSETKPTLPERAIARIREADGAFDVGDRTLRGKQKEFIVAAGDRLKAASVVRLTLADDRFILLSPKSLVEFRPEEKRLTLSLEVGDLHAELIGSGPEIRVATRSCEIQPLGTIFTVRADEKKSSVVVERGRVEVRGAKGKSAARAGESVMATEDGTVSAPFAADPRALAWTRGHRPAESTLLFEDFNKPGAWKAEVDKGVARAIPLPGQSASIEIAAEKPIFEVPVRGQIQVVCRADRAGRMYAQFFARDLRANFRKDVTILKGPAWRTIVFDFDEMVATDKSKFSGRPPAGTPIHDFGIYYGEEGDKGNLWVDSIRIVEVRP